VVPFLKVVNDTAVAVNQGGKSKGAVCSYLETWHLDIEEFLELRKNTGDDRRRTHDMNTANWIPDLFMKRVMENASGRCSRLGLPRAARQVGKSFEEAYLRYEDKAARGELKLYKKVPRCTCGARCCRCCSRPGIPGSPSRIPATCAARSSTSAWCTARTSAPRSRSTPDDEIAVCNLGSVNLVAHLTRATAHGLDFDKLRTRCAPRCGCSTT
jgi:ribonucleoside-diphosphate reductase alpha chain